MHVATAKLTKRLVDTLQPHPERELWVWDTEVRGLAVRLSPKGVRSFVLKFRSPTGMQRRIKLGRYGPLTVQNAKDLARRNLLRVAEGEDPALSRKAAREAPTLEEVAQEWLVVQKRRVSKGALSAKTVAEYCRLVSREVLPILGKRLASDVSRAEVRALHDRLGDRPTLANRTVSVLHSIFSWADDEGVVEGRNPASRVEKYVERRRGRIFTSAELGRIGSAMEHLESGGFLDPQIRRLVWCLALTGARPGELKAARGEDLDIPRRLLGVTGKSGRRPVVVAQRLLPVLEAQAGCSQGPRVPGAW